MTIDEAIEIIKTVRALVEWDDYEVAFDMAISALKAQSDKDNNVLSKKDGDCISRKWCLAEYDRQHVGPPGGARRIIAEAPAILPTQMSGTSEDTISRQAAIEAVEHITSSMSVCVNTDECHGMKRMQRQAVIELANLPSAQPTLYGYNIEHLELIARVLQKEDLPPERIVEVLTDIGRIVAIVKDEFEDTLRKAVEQCTI